MRIRNLFILLFLFYLVGCSDEPNGVGSALIPDNDKLNVLTIDSETESFDQEFVSFRKDSLFFGSSKRLLLGEYNNIKSEVLLSFFISLPDSIQSVLESSDSISLNSAWIEIYPDYWLGDSSSMIFSAHEIQTGWNPIDFNEDTLNAVRNSLSGNIVENIKFAEGDTVIKFHIFKEVAEKWIYNSFDDSYPENNGLLLSPISNTGIVGFQGVTAYPNTPFPILHMEFEKIEDFTDTAYAQPNLDIHIVSGEPLPDPMNEIILQGGIGVRGKLKFSLDKVPERILVNGAVLELFYNSENSFEANVETDTVAVSMLINFNSDSISTAFGKYPITKGNGSYSGDIKQFVQRWIDGEDNEGMEIKLNDENRGGSAISFYGSDHPNASLRPKLTISYTRK